MLYDFGQWELDIDLYELRCAGQFVRLEPLVFDVLVYLVLNRDRVISKQELMSHVWPDQFIGDSALERCIMAARKAVGDSGGRQHVIKTFYRRGYRFIAPVTEREPGELPVSQLPSPVHPLAPSPWPHHFGPDRLPVSDLVSVTSSGESDVAELSPQCQQTTVLSCSLAGSDLAYSRGERLALWDAFFERAKHQVKEHGGLMAEFMTDSFLALFGAIVPCEDHALRAVRIALELQEQLDEERLKLDLSPEVLSVRMSLHTGDMIGKQFGDEPRVMYMAVGDMMQFAANLQTCTEPGSVFLSSTTHRLVQAAVVAEVVGLISVQGHDIPVAAYRLHRLRSQATSRASSNC